MAIRIPQNQIVTSKYTIGKEYMYKDTYREYQGYYYELNNKLFTGKEFNSNAPELILIPKNNNVPSGFNSLLTKASTYVYGKISGTKIPSLNISSIPYKNDGGPEVLDENTPPQFYCKKINNQPILIKQISEDDFNILQSNPIYQTLRIDFKSQNYLEQAEKQMPGITTFLNL